MRPTLVLLADAAHASSDRSTRLTRGRIAVRNPLVLLCSQYAVTLVPLGSREVLLRSTRLTRVLLAVRGLREVDE
ncbi:uncharacterized protein SCHCODRAFT_02643544 [Schizophyllum commune H4-8]|uniref:uncharacterized protein n=1 Tax=Schizophyllum commune (strain H4-8 / FGSC 9210) TaxID=578458 RepID=UPI00215FF23E|nr:uncharacterized protein SCHCODRAFT_02643544 [Schizophyllum commune H4-8]KAI5886220.1 hypothetical protein SCHCODRAFT_02643544 [Schizophyllum commune H4-8]